MDYAGQSFSVADSDESPIFRLRFPQKLWRIVDECRNGAISWSPGGHSILLDYRRFQEDYLIPPANCFKTTNIASFIRQLNLYGFRKIASLRPSSPLMLTQDRLFARRDPLANLDLNCRNVADWHEYSHEYFRRGRLDLLHKVRRKNGKSKALTSTNPNTSCQRQEQQHLVASPSSEINQQQLDIGLRPDEEAATANSEESSWPLAEDYSWPEIKFTKLQLCQIGLTTALNQATEQYLREREHYENSSSDHTTISFEEPTNAHKNEAKDDINSLTFKEEYCLIGQTPEEYHSQISEHSVQNCNQDQFYWEEIIFVPNYNTVLIPNIKSEMI